MYSKRKYSGYIYIVEFGPQHVKIGKSKDPVRRLLTLSNQSGVRATRNWVSPACYNYGEIERELHEKFEKHRGIGEYFSLDFDVAVGSMWTFYLEPQSPERDAELDRAADAHSKALNELFAKQRLFPPLDPDKSSPTGDQDPVTGIPTPGELMLALAKNLLHQERLLEVQERRLAALEAASA